MSSHIYYSFSISVLRPASRGSGSSEVVGQPFRRGLDGVDLAGAEVPNPILTPDLVSQHKSLSSNLLEQFDNPDKFT